MFEGGFTITQSQYTQPQLDNLYRLVKGNGEEDLSKAGFTITMEEASQIVSDDLYGQIPPLFWPLFEPNEVKLNRDASKKLFESIADCQFDSDRISIIDDWSENKSYKNKPHERIQKNLGRLGLKIGLEKDAIHSNIVIKIASAQRATDELSQKIQTANSRKEVVDLIKGIDVFGRYLPLSNLDSDNFFTEGILFQAIEDCFKDQLDAAKADRLKTIEGVVEGESVDSRPAIVEESVNEGGLKVTIPVEPPPLLSLPGFEPLEPAAEVLPDSAAEEPREELMEEDAGREAPPAEVKKSFEESKKEAYEKLAEAKQLINQFQFEMSFCPFILEKFSSSNAEEQSLATRLNAIMTDHHSEATTIVGELLPLPHTLTSMNDIKKQREIGAEFQNDFQPVIYQLNELIAGFQKFSKDFQGRVSSPVFQEKESKEDIPNADILMVQLYLMPQGIEELFSQLPQNLEQLKKDEFNVDQVTEALKAIELRLGVEAKKEDLERLSKEVDKVFSTLAGFDSHFTALTENLDNIKEQKVDLFSTTRFEIIRSLANRCREYYKTTIEAQNSGIDSGEMVSIKIKLLRTAIDKLFTQIPDELTIDSIDLSEEQKRQSGIEKLFLLLKAMPVGFNNYLAMVEEKILKWDDLFKMDPAFLFKDNEDVYTRIKVLRNYDRLKEKIEKQQRALDESPALISKAEAILSNPILKKNFSDILSLEKTNDSYRMVLDEFQKVVDLYSQDLTREFIKTVSENIYTEPMLSRLAESRSFCELAIKNFEEWLFEARKEIRLQLKSEVGRLLNLDFEPVSTMEDALRSVKRVYDESQSIQRIVNALTYLSGTNFNRHLEILRKLNNQDSYGLEAGRIEVAQKELNKDLQELNEKFEEVNRLFLLCKNTISERLSPSTNIRRIIDIAKNIEAYLNYSFDYRLLETDFVKDIIADAAIFLEGIDEKLLILNAILKDPGENSFLVDFFSEIKADLVQSRFFLERIAAGSFQFGVDLNQYDKALLEAGDALQRNNAEEAEGILQLFFSENGFDYLLSHPGVINQVRALCSATLQEDGHYSSIEIKTLQDVLKTPNFILHDIDALLAIATIEIEKGSLNTALIDCVLDYPGSLKYLSANKKAMSQLQAINAKLVENISLFIFQADQKLFLSTTADDVLTYCRVNDKSEAAATQKVVLETNKLITFIVSDILKSQTINASVQAMIRWILAATLCAKNYDYNGVNAIISAINNKSIARLKQTKQLLPKDVARKYDELDALLSRENAFRKCKEAMKSEERAVPYLGIYITDITFQNDGMIFENPSKDIIDYFAVHQRAVRAAIPEDDLPDDFSKLIDEDCLLDDERSYQLSIQLEPRGIHIEPDKGLTKVLIRTSDQIAVNAAKMKAVGNVIKFREGHESNHKLLLSQIDNGPLLKILLEQGVSFQYLPLLNIQSVKKDLDNPPGKEELKANLMKNLPGLILTDGDAARIKQACFQQKLGMFFITDLLKPEATLKKASLLGKTSSGIEAIGSFIRRKTEPSIVIKRLREIGAEFIVTEEDVKNILQVYYLINSDLIGITQEDIASTVESFEIRLTQTKNLTESVEFYKSCDNELKSFESFYLKVTQELINLRELKSNTHEVFSMFPDRANWVRFGEQIELSIGNFESLLAVIDASKESLNQIKDGALRDIEGRFGILKEKNTNEIEAISSAEISVRQFLNNLDDGVSEEASSFDDGLLLHQSLTGSLLAENTHFRSLLINLRTACSSEGLFGEWIQNLDLLISQLSGRKISISRLLSEIDNAKRIISANEQRKVRERKRLEKDTAALGDREFGRQPAHDARAKRRQMRAGRTQPIDVETDGDLSPGKRTAEEQRERERKRLIKQKLIGERVKKTLVSGGAMVAAGATTAATAAGVGIAVGASKGFSLAKRAEGPVTKFSSKQISLLQQVFKGVSEFIKSPFSSGISSVSNGLSQLSSIKIRPFSIFKAPIVQPFNLVKQGFIFQAMIILSLFNEMLSAFWSMMAYINAPPPVAKSSAKSSLPDMSSLPDLSAADMQKIKSRQPSPKANVEPKKAQRIRQAPTL